MKYIIFILLLLSACPAHALTIGNYTDEDIAQAIYYAEGGAMAKKPFGILSVPCEGYDECKQICINSIRNQYRRWQANPQGKDYLTSLADRYCPIGAENDNGTNKYWLKNVVRLLKKGDK